MQTAIYEPIILDTKLKYRQTNQELVSTDSVIEGLCIPLTDKGMDRLTNAKVEHIMCTSALAAFY